MATRLSKEPKISAVYSSDLERALETAKMIVRSCGGVEVYDHQKLLYHVPFSHVNCMN